MAYLLLLFLAITADLIDYEAHAVAFAAMAVFLYGVRLLTDTIEKARL